MSETSHEQIEAHIVKTVSRLASLPADEIGHDDLLREDLGLDSLQSMELLSRVNDRYELALEIEDVMHVQTVGQLVTHLAEYLAKRAAS